MARRFKRSNFLFPIDLRPVDGNVSARPVDAFERASEGVIEQAPQRPYEINRPERTNNLIQLGSALGVASDQLNQIGSQQYEEYTQRAQQAGSALALQDERRGNKQSFKKLVSTTRVNSGDEAARELMGMNPHVKKGFDATRARSAALGFNAAFQAAYSGNPLLKEETGLRLNDVDVSDPDFQRWQSQFQAQYFAENGLDTLDPEALSTVVPAVQDVQNRVNINHDELRSSIKLQQFEDVTNEFVSDTLFDLNGNAEFIRGRDGQALQYTAELITAQIDEANALGYGGEDLQNLYGQIVASVINTATMTENPALLDVLEFIEVGRPDDRRLLMAETEQGSRLRPAVQSAKQAIIDREYQQGQRERTLRDQNKTDVLSESLERIAVTTALFETMGRPESGREALEKIVESERVRAAEAGVTVEFNSAISGVIQTAADNQGVNIVDYGAMARLEGMIDAGQLSGHAAKEELNQLMMNGSLGNNQQQAEHYLRLNQKIKAETDQSYGQFNNRVQQASNQYRGVIAGRLGFTEDERGRLTSMKSVLHESGFTEDQINTAANMTPDQMKAYITNLRVNRANRGQDLVSAQAEAVLMTMVTEGINPLDMPDAIDPGDIEKEVIQFQNQLAIGFEEFRQREGRDMTPSEMDEFIRNQSTAGMTGQLADLPGSNPLSARRRAATRRALVETSLYDSVFQGVSDRTGNAYKDPILSPDELFQSITHFSNTGLWHPELQDLAEQNGMSPMELIQRQANANGVDVDVSTYADIGIASPAQSNGQLPMSVFSSNQNYTTSERASAIAAAALSYNGKEFNAGIDAQCANFVRHIYRQMGIELPVSTDKTSSGDPEAGGWGEGFATSLIGSDVGAVMRTSNPNEIPPGAIVSFVNTYGNYPPGAITHVGISTGKGRMIDRSTSASPVRQRPITTFPPTSTGEYVYVIPHEVAAPKMAGGSSAPSGTSNRSKYMNGLAFIESTWNPTQKSSSGASGYFQAMPIFREDLARLGIPDHTQSSDPAKAASSVFMWIESQYPEAAKAIDNGDFATADRLLNRVWTSLPGGPEATQTSDRYRERDLYLQGSKQRFTF